MEVRDFAGQKVEVTRMVDPKSKEGRTVKQTADTKVGQRRGQRGGVDGLWFIVDGMKFMSQMFAVNSVWVNGLCF